MRPTLLLLLVVGLVSCIPREGLGRRLARDPSAEGGGDGSSSLALRSSSPDGVYEKDPFKKEIQESQAFKNVEERRKKPDYGNIEREIEAASKSKVYEKDPLLKEILEIPRFKNVEVRRKQEGNERGKRQLSKKIHFEDVSDHVQTTLENDENKDVINNCMAHKILDIIRKYIESKHSTDSLQTLSEYIKYQKLPKRYRTMTDYFDYAYENIAKELKKDKQLVNQEREEVTYRILELCIKYFDSRINIEEPKPPGAREMIRPHNPRFKRGELLERALRNFIVLSSHLNLNVTQNKTTPSADTMIKEVEEDQPAGKTDSRRSLGPVGGSEAQGGENDAQVDEVMDGGQKDEAEENNLEINAMVQENDDDDDDDDDDDNDDDNDDDDDDK